MCSLVPGKLTSLSSLSGSPGHLSKQGTLMSSSGLRQIIPSPSGYMWWLPPGPQALKNSASLLVPPSAAHRAPPSIPILCCFLLCLFSPLALHSPHTVQGLYSLSFMNIDTEPRDKNAMTILSVSEDTHSRVCWGTRGKGERIR